ncbi:GIP, partial [Symbiodinium sp. CCMP2456]
TASTGEPSSFQLPWQAIPRFIPGTTDVTEYSKKLQFLAAMWPKEHLSLLAPRAALMCEGTSFKKVASLDASKLKANDDSGVKLLVATLGGSWGKTALEEKYDSFEKAIYGTTQKADETNDSYLARHDVHFEELLAAGVSLGEVRAYILLRQSQLSADDRKRIVVEMGGTLDYKKVCSAIRLLGSRFFTDLQGQRSGKTKTYEANFVDEPTSEEPERAYQASAALANDDGDGDLDNEYIEALVAAEDQDAMQVQAFEEELEGFFQETPDLQEALVSYLEARGRLLAKKRSRGFWPVGSSSKGAKGGRAPKGKGKGKNAREQLLARISRSNCRACGERGHWKAECPKYGKGSHPAGKGETATTTVAQVDESVLASTEDPEAQVAEVCQDLPEGALTLEEEIRTMPLEELGKMKIDFGKTMTGRTYMDMAENETAWTKWIVEHMAQSKKRCHVNFLTFMERYVSEAEAVEGSLLESLEEVEPSARRARPKAVAKCTTSRTVASTEAIPEAWDVISVDDQGPPLDHQVTALANRMSQMESVMQQVLVAIQDLSSDKAHNLLKSKAPVPELKRFLRVREGVELIKEEDLKPPAYVVFGMYVHGGKVGVTRVSREFPNLTQVLSRICRETNPQHQFTSITISRNTQSSPHRDSYNSAEIPNLVIPLEYPRAGGEIWVEQPPRFQQQSVSLTCGSREREGSLIHLKPQVYVDPHRWHATMPWTGNRAVAICYAVKPTWKLEASEATWLRTHGFVLPDLRSDAPALVSHGSPENLKDTSSPSLRQELDSAKHFLGESALANLASRARVASESAYSKAEEASWNVFKDTLLAYGQPEDSQLDVLEVYASPDSRLTNWVNSMGGRAMRFTSQDGDLSTPHGQRVLWELLQRRTVGVPSATTPHESELPTTEWQALFDALQSKFPDFNVMQVFVGKGSRVAADGACKFVCLGREDRTTMAADRKSDEIMEHWQAVSARVFVSAAAWQRGRVERHGDIMKAKNALVRHRGYSPEQIVLGKSVKVPGSLTSDEVDPHLEGCRLPSLVRKVDVPKLEGRALVLQTVSSAKFPLSSFDIKTAFLRGKADASNPLAMAYAMSKAVDMLGWMRALWGVVHEARFDWRHLEQGYQTLNPAIVVTDCKSLYDLVTRLAMPACEEYRTTLEVLLIKQRCAENTRFRWIPTTLQAADCLTKSMDASLLRAVLAQGRFKLFDNTLTLEKDAQRKQAIQWLSDPPAGSTEQ